jgi:FkbM family methyltransferase
VRNRMLGRTLHKCRQIVSFYRHSRTPLSLTLDVLKIKNSPFVAISKDGLKLALLPRSGESYSFYENIVRRYYLQNGITLRPGSTIIDIGANIGTFAVLAGSIVGPTGRVIAFEPVYETFERLKRNVASNGLHNTECHRAAIDSREGTITLRVFEKSAYSSAYFDYKTDDDRPSETVSCLTLDQVFKDFQIERVNLLKVDCEGSEFGIFETLSTDSAARIDQIAMEVHEVKGAGGDRLFERLVALGFTVRRGPIWTAFNARG